MARPRQQGLTENEFEVMQVLWEESPLKVSDILERIPRKPKPAYTSLLTLIQTMEKKAYIRHTKIGKAFSYDPVLPRKKYLKTEIQRVARRLFNGTPGAMVLNLVQQEELSRDEIAALKAWLKEGS
jgi:BlaI family penicillinase repressor